MKRRYIMLGLLLLLVLVFVAALAGPASAGATKTHLTHFTLTRTDGPDSGVYGREVWNADGTVQRVFHRVLIFYDVSTDNRLTGTTYFDDSYTATFPNNLFSARGYGTYRTELPNGKGVWKGTYLSKAELNDAGILHVFLEGEGQGVAGIVAGLKVKWTAEQVIDFNSGPDLPPRPVSNTGAGYILEKVGCSHR